MNRRDVLKTAAFALPAVSYSQARPTSKLGIPGPFPGRVIAVHHPASIVAGAYQRDAVRVMLHKGLMELTGAETPAEAWRYFFEPGDVVGLKLNPVGRPFVISAPEVVQEIIEGLKMAGVKPRDIVAYDRYRREFLKAGFDTWLPEGVRWMWATDAPHPLQLDMDGYDPDHYMETAVVLPEANPSDPHHRRSYVAKFLTREVNKMINLCVLKHHQSAGITLALKNLSHGLVNNVSRSHSSPTLNTCGTFIPAVVDLPVIRQKVVLHILDAVKGAYHGGPGRRVEKYVWEHKTMYFATDPVALDKIGWKVIDAKRLEMGMKPVGEAPPDADSRFYRMQPEHVEIAAVLGLGVFDDRKIDLRKFDLG
ncbi:MAG: DUF362 domain-containing protein [Bryobacterales bacterium]|nr:DUF362 domain-containing protein [Bryobacteraceae bacterium]MDW8353949.1 DUF362 domain-containing protein [Bryobacterales bacterium]